MKPEDSHRFFQKCFIEQDLEGLGTLYAENAIFIPGSERNPIVLYNGDLSLQFNFFSTSFSLA
jgi:hypothetical protein